MAWNSIEKSRLAFHEITSRVVLTCGMRTRPDKAIKKKETLSSVLKQFQTACEHNDISLCAQFLTIHTGFDFVFPDTQVLAFLTVTVY